MIVYLIHFSRKLGHAQHYIGKTEAYGRRMTAHKAGNGAAILRAAKLKGIKWRVVARWFGGRKLEKELKARHDAAALCPICKRKRLAYKRKWARQNRKGAKRERSKGS